MRKGGIHHQWEDKNYKGRYLECQCNTGQYERNASLEESEVVIPLAIPKTPWVANWWFTVEQKPNQKTAINSKAHG